MSRNVPEDVKSHTRRSLLFDLAPALGILAMFGVLIGAALWTWGREPAFWRVLRRSMRYWR